MSHDLSSLFSAATPLRTFSTSNIAEVPAFGSIIYTVFLDGTDYIYVGIGGLAGAAPGTENGGQVLCLPLDHATCEEAVACFSRSRGEGKDCICEKSSKEIIHHPKISQGDDKTDKVCYKDD